MASFSVTRLTLTSFRNYESLRLAPAQGLLALVGPNGAGKTNLLEAISLLVPGRGLRGVEFSEMSRSAVATGWGIAAVATTPQGEFQLGTAWRQSDDSSARSVMVDGVAQRSSGILAEHMRAIWLTPAMDRLFLGPPADRRRFLDRIVMLFDVTHGTRVTSFEKLMRERNRLLEEQSSDRTWLASLEAQMAEAGVAVAAARVNALAHLKRHSVTHDEEHFPWAELAIDGILEAEVAQSPAMTVEERYRRMLAEGRALDAAAGRTLIGPHRSDLQVIHGPKATAAAQCSTGEQKALLIGLVLAQARATAELAGGAPILLLDEIAAHLDRVRRTALFGLLKNLSAQVFMTGTEAQLFDGAGPSAVVYQVDRGQISESL